MKVVTESFLQEVCYNEYPGILHTSSQQIFCRITFFLTFLLFFVFVDFHKEF